MEGACKCIADLLSARQWEVAVRQLGLSPRQAQVARAMLMNATVSEAAAQLGIHPDTVKTYIKRCYQRLEINSRLQLVLRVLSAATAADPVLLPGDTPRGGLRRQSLPR